jgi:plasmid stabilization system protein ParE
MNYRLSPSTEEDLDKVWRYVAEQASEDTAQTLVYDIVDESYLVYYRIETDVVVISRVLHGSQDQVAAWRESEGETEQT